ncbi:MAG: tetratricopeptide repeat protein [Cyanobacteria bacterium Co-bin13]|nr:tetratricopeptide repeat protein [Cyanobacteria bacterium Co-bin13]
MRQWAQDWSRGQVARYRYRRGLDLIRKGNYEAAIAVLTAAIEHHPRPAQIYITRGITRWQAGDLQNALADFTEATQDPKLGAKAYGNRGLLRYQLGDEQGALADWQQAIAVGPRDARVYYNRALLFIQKSRYSEALADLNQALAINPNLAEAYYHRGNVFYELQDTNRAIADWELALCNDLRLEQARLRLQQVQQNPLDDLSQKLQSALTVQQVQIAVSQSGNQLDIDIRRPKGKGVNYFTLPELIRNRLIAWQVPGIRKFRIIGKVEDQSLPEWQQVYTLYQGQPSPPAYWRLASLTTLLIFPPLGIAALVYAYRVGESYRRGDYPLALQASKTVRALCLTGIGVMGSIGVMALGYLGFTQLRSLRSRPAQPRQALLSRSLPRRPLKPAFQLAPAAEQPARGGSSAHTFQRADESRDYRLDRLRDSQA